MQIAFNHKKAPVILFEDNHCIVVHKPAGILVQGDISGEPSLLDEVRNYIKIRDHKPGNVFLGLIHRLDRNVEGIVVFGKTSKGASRISEQIRNHSFVKEYHAWVAGELQPHKGHLIHYIERDVAHNVSRALTYPRNGALKAELSYEVVQTNVLQDSLEHKCSLVRIQLMTGRHHQIRAQFSAVHNPILGDTKYGSKIKIKDQRIALYATSIKFTRVVPQPGQEPVITVSIPVPDIPKIL